ncbi:hypothetical protein GCM10010269_63110 [Streptomyces humidus]|uniref:Uncharacterized protein n=1 Tax=Streptomyces humidus TaxID=52259 RepID=A0A918G2J1_9ACTN|nr:hypothetical protein [Streptomyces humidus]GGS15240.1 hypothetical protein GCM10010269_63110 [Streptomyces humidus]
MSPSFSSPTPTWQVVLPWLDQLEPEELLALQRLGGPAQWWLRETPEETSLRRPYMDDVFDLFASFLCWGSGSVLLDEKQLLLLLPFLPKDMPTAELALDARALEVLEAAGGRTLGEVGQLAAMDILNLPKVRIEIKREVLAALVRAGVTFPQRDRTEESTVPAAAGSSSSAEPDTAICEWFVGLDARQQDLITLHLCAVSPLPVDELAARYRTMRPWMTRLLDELPERLETAASDSTGIRSALTLFSTATVAPITRSDLLEQHPWLAVKLPGSNVMVLELLVALHWSGTIDGEWLFSGSLEEMRKLTRDALDLEAGECLSWAATRRLIEGTSESLKATEGWLRYCGLRLVDDRQVELGETSQPVTDQTGASAVEGDYELAPPRPATEAASLEEALRGSPAQTHEDSLPGPAQSGDATPELIDVLEQLREFACEHRPGEQLADLLRDSDEFPEPLRTLMSRILAAVARADGWELPDDALSSDASAAPARTLDADSAAGSGSRRETLNDRAWNVLNELGHPLDSNLLVDRMGSDVNIRSLKAQLPRDSRFVRSDVDSWALNEWGLRPYTTIKELVTEEVDLANGSIPTDELVAILTREFTINESSVRQVASSPPFTARGGVVRRLSDVRREEHDERASADSSAESPDDDGPSPDDLIDLMGL